MTDVHTDTDNSSSCRGVGCIGCGNGRSVGSYDHAGEGVDGGGVGLPMEAQSLDDDGHELDIAVDHHAYPSTSIADTDEQLIHVIISMSGIHRAAPGRVKAAKRLAA